MRIAVSEHNKKPVTASLTILCANQDFLSTSCEEFEKLGDFKRAAEGRREASGMMEEYDQKVLMQMNQQNT